jgi:hypothetical protein
MPDGHSRGNTSIAFAQIDQVKLQDHGNFARTAEMLGIPQPARYDLNEALWLESDMSCLLPPLRYGSHPKLNPEDRSS